MVVSSWRAALTVCLVGSCAGSTPATVGTPAAARPSLTVVVASGVPGRERVVAEARAALAGGFAVRLADFPNAPPVADDTAAVEATLAEARRAYIAAEFTACLERVSDDARLDGLLARGRRTQAERLLFWRIACRTSSGRAPAAAPDAAAFVTLGFEIPADVEAASPEVEVVLAAAARAAEATPRHALAVEAGAATRLPPAVHVAVDGRERLCVAPCTVDVPDGDHVVAVAADGYQPDSRRVRVGTAGAHVSFTLQAAPADLAARQWTARYAGGDAIDGPQSLALLATAIGSRNLVLLLAEPAGRDLRLRGVLALDGGVAARAERSAPAAALAAETPGLLHDLLVRGRLVEPPPPLVKRPLFWVAVGTATLVAVGATALVLYQPPVRTRVGF